MRSKAAERLLDLYEKYNGDRTLVFLNFDEKYLDGEYLERLESRIDHLEDELGERKIEIERLRRDLDGEGIAAD